MNTNQYTKIESTDIRNTKEKNEKSLESTLPPVEEMEKIISDMMLKGCYVSDIYERFGWSVLTNRIRIRRSKTIHQILRRTVLTNY